MGQTIAEKILSRVSGRDDARAGDEVLAKPDFVIAYDFPGYTDVIFRQMEEDFGIDKVADVEILFFKNYVRRARQPTDSQRRFTQKRRATTSFVASEVHDQFVVTSYGEAHFTHRRAA